MRISSKNCQLTTLFEIILAYKVNLLHRKIVKFLLRIIMNKLNKSHKNRFLTQAIPAKNYKLIYKIMFKENRPSIIKIHQSIYQALIYQMSSKINKIKLKILTKMFAILMIFY